ncbi:hypothetical protein D9613_009983 [Agrocybe pediades]|uniref:CENP-V/GFA domain-containing protein n=1 Tax=Agrocybe pediades TaxID=84607 RepID=A0A8H4VS90_9AGAR|nr:hypothetical protein D9613_009983 [Agrocybe pediades]
MEPAGPLTADSTPESQSPADLSTLKVYRATQHMDRYFCPSCFAYLFYATNGPNRLWMVSSGALERVEGIVKVGYHNYLADTLDGGISDSFRTLDSIELPRYAKDEGSPMLPLGWRADNLLEVNDGRQRDYLPIHCHCKAVSLQLTRPSVEESMDPVAWWIKSQEGKGSGSTSRPRFTGVHCVCNSCRLSSGSLIQSWLIVPRTHVIDEHTSQPVLLSRRSDRIQGLVQYESSPGTYRESCGTCGAKVFQWSLKKTFLPPAVEDEPVIIYVGAGLVDQEVAGSRADNWFFWKKTVNFPEDAVDKSGLKALTTGLEVA